MRTHLNEILKLGLSILISQSAGLLGAIFTRSSISNWYRYLEKPSFTPSGRFISLIWTALYLLMGISAFLIWRKGLEYPMVKGALAIYGVQLSINVLWSWAFFYLRSPLAGLIVIPVLWASILATILKFRKISTAAAVLLIPYLLWVSFAAYLNYAIWRLNRRYAA
ncbi:MAG TPA: TspO/MBR family protein [Methanotrichaceae archaeon]|nr:TspO/MBR family protein [Methanotrichaceae archaeon]